MSNLYDPVIKKIEELGETKASEYFKRSRQTIYAWKKSPTKIPLIAVQQVLDEGGNKARDIPESPPKVTREVPVSEPSETPPVLTPAWAEEVNTRLGRLEDFARLMTDPDRKPLAQTSGTRPVAPVSPAGALIAQPTQELGTAPEAATKVPTEGWNAPRPVKR